MSPRSIPISIHAPVKGATRLKKYRCKMIRNFNPRSREGSDSISYEGVIMDGKISIHAPVKGATKVHATASLGHSISIHAPVKGATGRGFYRLGYGHISIHAPVKGATDTSGV